MHSIHRQRSAQDCTPMHALTIGGTVLKESDDRDILEVTFDSEMSFKNHLGSVSSWKSWKSSCLPYPSHLFLLSYQIFIAYG